MSKKEEKTDDKKEEIKIDPPKEDDKKEPINIMEPVKGDDNKKSEEKQDLKPLMEKIDKLADALTPKIEEKTEPPKHEEIKQEKTMWDHMGELI